jgi:hypothetical protein
MTLKHLFASILAIAYAYQVTGFQLMFSVGYLCYRNKNQLHPVLTRDNKKLLGMRSRDSNIDLLHTNDELFNSILRDKVPAYKNENKDYLIINAINNTMLHPYISSDEKINTYMTEVLSSGREASSRLKPLFAVVTGMGRGKTRMFVELQKQFNSKPNVFCLAITFNNYWKDILIAPTAPEYIGSIGFQYVFNVIARIISMNYHITLAAAEDLLLHAFEKFDINSGKISTMIHDCVKYIIGQYRANGKNIDEFVLLVDETVSIQDDLDPSGKVDVHHSLRECLLTQPMVMDDGLPVKVDLVMSG